MTEENRQPLPLPENFNPETNLLANTTEYGTFHESRKGARLARDLVANGTPQDLALAESVLDATLSCQELRQNDPHLGNFFWMAEDEVVFDLNAVEFVLEQLIPMMIQHRDRLSSDIQARVLQSIHLGLDEIRRLDVLVAYSNITVLDILNSCLGGELLQDKAIAQRGYQKLMAWMALTDQFGIPFEYNSPTYTAVTLRALKVLADLVQDEATRIRARTVAARLGLSVALHIHPKTGRWAGPHSRAYHPSVVGEAAPEIEMLRAWAENDTVPAWVLDAVADRPTPFSVSETANIERNHTTERDDTITTYHSQSFALGVSATGFGGQSNAFLAQYHRPDLDRPGVVYTRYTLNDKWLGDSYHATDRTKSRNLIDEGRFFGAQEGNRAIGLYAPNNLGLCSSAKANIVWTGRDQADEIWIGGRRVEALPADVAPGEVVVIGSGDIYMAVRPLILTDLGREAPIRLLERAGDLALELHNYLGSEKHFWEMRWPGAFYQGQPRCGFYAEIVERSAYPDGRAFGETVAAGDLIDQADAPFVYAGEGERRWTVSYARDGREVGLEIDLMAWRLKRRWTQDGDLGYPMLESSIARQNRNGKVVVGQAVLTCGQEAGWLFASPKDKRWVAGYHGQQSAPLILQLPDGSVELDGIATGTIVWDNGQVRIEAIGLKGEPKITGGSLVRD
jgi:hypothetical protein